MTAWLPTLAWCALVVVFAALANVWNGHDRGWYAELRRPFFQPPDVVFALMWPLNFALLLLVGVTAVRTSPTDVAWTATGVLAGSVVLALGWAWLFYVPHRSGRRPPAWRGRPCRVLARRGPPDRPGVGLATVRAVVSVATALAAAYARLN